MSNYSALKTAIQQAVYTNGNNEITGAGLQSVLLQIVNTVGDGYVFKGVATAGTSPGTPDANVFYIAPAGTYTNFGSSYTVPDGHIGVFTYNGSWNRSSFNTCSGFTPLANVGYYECTNGASTAAKTVAASGYVLTNGGAIKIKFTNENTAASPTLNINGTGAKQIYYNNELVGIQNTWERGEVCIVYYDGTYYRAFGLGRAIPTRYSAKVPTFDPNKLFGRKVVDLLDWSTIYDTPFRIQANTGTLVDRSGTRYIASNLIGIEANTWYILTPRNTVTPSGSNISNVWLYTASGAFVSGFTAYAGGTYENGDGYIRFKVDTDMKMRLILYADDVAVTAYDRPTFLNNDYRLYKADTPDGLLINESFLPFVDEYRYLSLFSNILDYTDLSQFDLTKRIDTLGTLVSNSGSQRYIINKGLELSPGTYYISGSFGFATPRVSINGSSLASVTLVSNGVYSFTLSKEATVYIGWYLNADLSEINDYALLTLDRNFDRIKNAISWHYLGLEKASDYTQLVELVSKNMIDESAVTFGFYYSPGQNKLFNTDGQYAATEFIDVVEGQTYCVSGQAIGANLFAGYFAADASYINGQAALSRVEAYSAHGGGYYFTVPSGQNIAKVVITLATNEDVDALVGHAQMEVGENPTDYTPYDPKPKIKQDLLPNSSGSIPVDTSALAKYTDFQSLHYEGISEKIPNFKAHWLAKDKDLCVVNTGTSLTARDYCSPRADAPYRPPLMHTYNLASYVWDKLDWGKQQYRRYDAKTENGGNSNMFTETGTFTTKETDTNWDDSSYRRCYTRVAETGNNAVAFKVPSNAWQFNFIYRTDLTGATDCTIAITEGNGKMEVWNGSAWVEANGYVFSMREGSADVIPSVSFVDPYTGNTSTVSNIATGGNTTYQKRLKMRSLTHTTKKSDGTVIVAGETKSVTISATNGRFMYWGVEWSPRQYMITYINAARGSHGPLIGTSANNLIHYQDNEVWSFEPDLILTEDPIFNGGGGAANLWFSGTTPIAPLTYWGQVVENFFFANNQVSMKARATTLLGAENVPEFAIFGPYSTALDGKVDDDGELRAYPTSDGYMLTVADALALAAKHIQDTYPDVIYINCIRTWMDCVRDVYGGSIDDATVASRATGSSLTNDGVHPNDNGSMVWARLVLPIIDFTL